MHKVYLAMTAVTCKILGAMKHNIDFMCFGRIMICSRYSGGGNMENMQKYGAFSVSSLCLLGVCFSLLWWKCSPTCAENLEINATKISI